MTLPPVNKVHHVHTIARVAEMLGEDEDWLCDVATEMDQEDGLIWVYGPGDAGVIAFTNFGIDVPWLIPPCYAAFLGLESYFVYYMLRKGITVNQCVMVWAVGGLTDAIMETVGLNLRPKN